MRRMFTALLFALGAGSLALGHALYVVPEGNDKVVVVFGHSLSPDPKTKDSSWQKLAGLKLLAHTDAGTTTPIDWRKGEHCLVAKVPTGTRFVSGDVDYGVHAKAGNPPRRIRFVPRAIVGDPTVDRVLQGKDCPLEIVPEVEAGKVRFRVLARNEPVAKAEVEVMVPEKAEHVDVTTDEDGRTPAFDAKGQYGVATRRETKTSGEVNGQKYEAEVTVATLVVTVK